MAEVGPPLAELQPPVKVLQVDLGADLGRLEVGGQYAWARVLLRRGPAVGPVVMVPVREGSVLPRDVLTAAAEHPDVPVLPAPSLPEHLSVAVTIGTRNRPESLRRTLASLALCPGDLEIIVVDNAPTDGRTRQTVDACRDVDARIRYVLEPTPGLAVARNTALRVTDSDVLLFTDDDVEVDRWWVACHASALADPSVGLSSGPGLAAALDSVEEIRAEAVLGFDKGPTPARYELASAPADAPLFPWTPGLFGGGLNFAVRTGHARRIGGFDEALGAGTPTRGGEDGDFTVRSVRSGMALEYTPHALVWHHHRQGAGAFAAQVVGNATGLGALLTKFGSDPRDLVAIATRAPAAARRLRALRRTASDSGLETALRRREVAALATGPWRYWSSRRAVAARGGHLGQSPLPPWADR